MSTTADDDVLLGRLFPGHLRELRKNAKKTQMELGDELDGFNRQQIAAIEKGRRSPNIYTRIGRLWVEKCGIHPRSAQAQEIYLLSGYPVFPPDCPCCLGDVARMIEARTIHCPHLEGLILPEDQSTVARRSEEFRARKADKKSSCQRLPRSL